VAAADVGGARADSEATPHGGVQWWWRWHKGGARAKQKCGVREHCGARRGGNRCWYEYLTFVGFHHTFVTDEYTTMYIRQLTNECMVPMVIGSRYIPQFQYRGI
jgi:hypothetical protein